MGYFLFLLVTATLFIRPAEISESIIGWPIYECVILACLAASISPVLKQLSAKSLFENPITACVMGPAGGGRPVAFGSLGPRYARISGLMFFKIAVYYLLLVANINSEMRLRSFLGWLLLLIALVAVLSLLGAYHVIQFPGVEFFAQRQHDRVTGELTAIIPPAERRHLQQS